MSTYSTVDVGVGQGPIVHWLMLTAWGVLGDASERESHFRRVSLIPWHGYHTSDEERRLAFTWKQLLRLLQVASAQICKCAGDRTSADGCVDFFLRHYSRNATGWVNRQQ